MKKNFAIVSTLLAAALFALLMPAKVRAAGSVVNESTGTAYTSIAAAVGEVSAGEDAVLTAEGDFTEDVTLNMDSKVTIKAGAGGCQLNGKVSVSNGSLFLEGLGINGSVTYTGTGSAGEVTDCNINTTGTGITVTGGAQVDQILRVNISGGSRGILVGPGGLIGTIDGGENKSTVTGSMQGIAIDIYDNGSNHSNSGRIGRIANCSIASTGSSTSTTSQYGGIVMRGWEPNATAEIGTVENCEISAASGYQYHGGIMMINDDEGAPVTLQQIKNCTITTTGNSSGIVLQYAQIGEILGTDIHASQGAGRAIIYGVMGSGTVPACPNHIGKIDGGEGRCSLSSESANAIYMVSRTGYGIGSIANADITGYYAGIYLAGGDVGDITNVTIMQTYEGANSSSNYGGIIEKASNVKIGNLTNVEIDAQGLGIYLHTNVTAGDMDHVIIKAGKQDTAYQSGAGIYALTGSTIRSISHDSEITSEKSYGLALNGSEIMGKISDTRINGRYIGVSNSGGRIGGMENVDVTVTRREQGGQRNRQRCRKQLYGDRRDR
ncbi:MAG: hypothetical protein J5935_00295 [Lachnospiraceae bacterium]|nr:hypothetical protein [Lachnospiraceae bacterium]